MTMVMAAVHMHVWKALHAYACQEPHGMCSLYKLLVNSISQLQRCLVPICMPHLPHTKMLYLPWLFMTEERESSAVFNLEPCI